MRRFRMYGAALSVAALLGATAAAGGTAAAAAPSGVGTSRATTTAVSVALGTDGSILNVRVAGDDGTANIDPKQGKPASAASSLAPLTASSQVSPSVPQLNFSLPKLSVSSTGAADNKSVPSISLATPLSTGTINPLSLSAAVDTTQGAASGLNSAINNLSVAGGLLSLPPGSSATSTLGAAAKPGDADGLRGLTIPTIQVLNLGAVLQGLGISSSALQVGQIGAALGTLGVTVPNGSGGALTGDQLVAAISGTTTPPAPGLSSLLTSDLPNGLHGVDPALPVNPTIPAPLQTIIGGLIPGGFPAGATTVGDVVTSIDNQIKGLLTGGLNGLINTPLLQVKDLVIGVTTKASDTVANSAADIKASLGSIQVGNLTVPGVDLAAVATNANATIKTVLSQVGLGDLISVKVLDESKSIGTQAGYVNALANLTAVHVAIAPLSSLTPGTAQAATDTVGQLYTLAGGGTPPALSPAMAVLNGLLPTTGAGALAQGATVDVLSVGGASAFLPTSTPSNPAAPTAPNGSLAVTGGPTQILGFVGLLLLATVAGLRWLRRPAPTD